LLSAQQRAADAEGRCQQLEAQLDAAGALLQPEDQPIAGSLDEFSGQVDGAALTGQQNDRFSMDTAATGTETAASSPPVNQATSQVAWMLRPADHIAEDQSDRVHSDYDVQPQQLWREDVASAADTEAVTPGRDRCGSLNEPDEIAFADWLADALRREDMTMEEAALQIGVSVKTFSRWVGGITEPGLRDLRRLRDFFGDFPFP